MKSVIKLIIIITIITFFFSCKKDPGFTCGNGNICFRLNNIQHSYKAKWYYLIAQRKYRIDFRSQSGGVSNERLELDFVNGEGLKTGDYDFAGNILQDGSAALFYYKNDNGVINQVTCKMEP